MKQMIAKTTIAQKFEGKIAQPKWTSARIKRALDIIDMQNKCNVVATTEKSQRMLDADFLRTYRKNLEFETQDDFREYVEMSRTQEINFLLKRLS